MTKYSFSAPRFEPSDLASEIESLPLEIREKVHRDLYGLDDPPVEVDADVALALEQLGFALTRISDKTEYNRADELCPSYVNSQEFHLMFLRSANFDAQLAAERMVVYWREKEIVFGAEKTYHRLSVADLEQIDLRVIEAGGMIALQERDNHGRGLIFTDVTKWSDARQAMNRVTFYLAHILLEDVEVQRRGIVLVRAFTVSFNMEHFYRKVDNRMMLSFRNALPVRIVGIHFIVKSSLSNLVFPFVLNTVGPHLRPYVRIHENSSDEGILSDLCQYGIPPSMIPRHAGGTLDLPEIVTSINQDAS